MVPELLVLALAFHRAPLRFSHLTDPERPLPDVFGTWLAAASNALAPGCIQTTAAALGRPPGELQQAFLFFLRQTLLSPRADHYRVLGLSRNCSEASIKHHHSLLMRLFHPDRRPDEDECNNALAARINAAYQTLRDPQARSRYDRRLPPVPASAVARAEVPDFFRPREPIAKLGGLVRRSPIQARRSRRAVPWTLAASALIVLLFLLLFSLLKPEQPVVRLNPELAPAPDSGPSYLRSGKAWPAPSDKAEPEARDPPLKADAPRNERPTVTYPSKMIHRLTP